MAVGTDGQFAMLFYSFFFHSVLDGSCETPLYLSMRRESRVANTYVFPTLCLLFHVGRYM